jgi:hypothetical protein
MTPGTDGKDYYGILEEIYELQFCGAEPLVLSYSNAGGLILRYRDSTLILG